MSTPFVLAHLSDVHLGPLPRFEKAHWNAKRVLGWANWMRKRRSTHRLDVVERLLADLAAQSPTHLAVTGDLINIGLPEEYVGATRWLDGFGSSSDVSVVPGNHDIYSELGSDPGVARWAAWMSTFDDTGVSAATDAAWSTDSFPWVRQLGQVVLIGVNSAIPTAPFRAIGHVGDAQMQRLDKILARLADKPVTRVVLVHHPALPGQAIPSKALTDAAALETVLQRHGVELVLHGHNHKRMLAFRQGPTGPISFVGVPSASAAVARGGEDLARYHLFRLTPGDRTAPIELIARGLATPNGPVVELERCRLIADESLRRAAMIMARSG
jgi:3',5'-cyclic AMP phosphodiesterase CpdA